MSSKRKASGPARSVEHKADFKKLKHKVGKKAPQKANVTNTSFATKSIHIPTQRIVDSSAPALAFHAEGATEGHGAAASAAATVASVNVHDLYTQLKHYNVNVRREALNQLRDACGKNPQILQLEAATIFQVTLPCLLDEDRSVRTALLALVSMMFPILGPHGVSPFQGILISYICSGLSHMHFTVKRSALQCLKSLIELEKSGGSTAGGLQLWSLSHVQVLPNLLACLVERVFVTKQANIATTEALTMKKSDTSAATAAAAANSSAGNLANRAMMLQCLEQFLALCPFAATGSATTGSSDTKTSTSSSMPSLLHSSALNSLIYPDPTLLTSMDTSTSSSDLASSILAGTKSIPLKYQRKNAQHMKFYSPPSTTTSTTNSQTKSASPLQSFLNQLLPLSIEYWLESFGLASSQTSTNSSGGAPSTSSTTPSKATASSADLLANLSSILKLMHLSLDILRGQLLETHRNQLIESGGNDAIDHKNVSDIDSLNLPTGFTSGVRQHVFHAFPFTAEFLGPAGLANTSEHQQRSLHALNAECVGLMSGFLSPHTSVSAPSSIAADRRKSGSSRQLKQATEDEQWLARIIDYLASSFQALTEVNQSKAEARRLSFAPPAVSHDTDIKDVETEFDTKPLSSSASAVPAASSSSFPNTPRGVGRSSKKSRKSGLQAAASLAPVGLEHSSLSDLLPLLHTLLPRLPFDRQQWLVASFLSYYIHCHPLSNAKLACLRFMQDYLFTHINGLIWFRHDDLRRTLVDEGEWVGLLGVLAAAIGNQIQLQQMKNEELTATADSATTSLLSTTKSTTAPTSPLLLRYYSMFEVLIQLLLTSGRVFHGQVLDYNIIQEQLISCFGTLDIEVESTTTPKVIPGPFWGLPLALQHRSLQLLYYFHALHPNLIQVLLECLRGRIVDDGNSTLITLESKQLVLDMLSEKHGVWPGGVSHYIAFILGLIRSDFIHQEPATITEFDRTNVSPLLPTALRMLQSITDEELLQVLYPAQVDSYTRSNQLLFDLLTPLLSECFTANLSGSFQTVKLDWYSSFLLLDSLLVRSDRVVFPSTFTSQLLPAALCRFLSHHLTHELVESGLALQYPKNLVTMPSEVCLEKPWLLSARLILLTQTDLTILQHILQLLQHDLHSTDSDRLRSSLLLFIWFVRSITRAGYHTLLTVHHQRVLDMGHFIQAHTNDFSRYSTPTMLANLKTELTALFGQKGEFESETAADRSTTMDLTL